MALRSDLKIYLQIAKRQGGEHLAYKIQYYISNTYKKRKQGICVTSSSRNSKGTSSFIQN